MCSAELEEDYISEINPPARGTSWHRQKPWKTSRVLGFVGPGFRARMIDAADACGRTPLAWAVEMVCPEAVEALIEYGSDSH